MTEKVVKLDVREDIRQGREPFTRIMQAAAGLKNDEALLLIAPFEPVPLYRMMARQGFDHKSRTAGTGDWEVLFRRGRGSEAASESITEVESAPACNGTGPGEMVEVDARGLEPPQPLVTILEALATLPPGAQLRARTDRRPMHLYAQLQERGFVGETEAQADGSFITVVRRR